MAPDGYKFERSEIVSIRKLDCKVIFDQKGRPKIHCVEMNELFGCRKTCYYVKTFCGIIYSRVTIAVKCEVVDAEEI